MRSSSNGPATFLMLLTLGAMAVVGVFGLPQFPPVVASSGSENDGEVPDDLASFEPSRSGESVAQGVEDLFASVETPHDERLSPDNAAFPAIETDEANEAGIVDLLAAADVQPEVQSQPAVDNGVTGSRSPGSELNSQPIENGATIAGTQSTRQQPEPRSAGLDSRFGRRSNADSIPASFGAGFQDEPVRTAEAPVARPSLRLAVADGNPAVVRVADTGGSAANAAGAKPLTWRSAVDRLRALGINHYRLAPGTAPNGFHFSCFFSPGGDPRITQRFEAEANEPLGAVEQVLAQIDGWRKQHTESQASRTANDIVGPVAGNAVADRSTGRK